MDLPDPGIEEIVVEDQRPSSGAVDRSLDRQMVEAFPARSPDELLRALPGLHQSAHGGRGKAYQVFLRGFDAEHGTALAVDLEGVPLNEVDNVHGHGYLDLHLIPELLVRGVELHAGPPRSEDGNFAVIGAASYRLGLERPGLYVEAGGGSDRSGSGAAAWRPRGAPPGTFLAASGTSGLGAGPQRAWSQVSAGAGYERAWAGGRARGFVLAHDGTFESPGALREDDLDELGAYGAYAAAGGGRSRRLLGATIAEASGPGGEVRGLCWGGLRQLGLRQNFTGFLLDEQDGDGTLQRFDLAQGGASLRGTLALPFPLGDLALRAGGDLRHDATRGQIDAADAAYVPTASLLDARTRQTDGGLWAELRAQPVSALRVEGGGRFDAIVASVDDPGTRRASAIVASPSGRAVLTPARPVELSLSAGRGLRSPESRAVVQGARAQVTVTSVYEAGAGLRLPSGLALRAAAFRADLDDELVFDHTLARYVSGGTTRRIGATGTIEWAPTDAVVVLSDLTWADGRFVATGAPIPFAPRWLSSTGVFLRQLPAGPALLTGGLRIWSLGRRPLPDGFVSRPAVAADLVASAEIGRHTLSIEVDNALGSRWRDGEFVYPSRWDLSEPRSERPELHLTAGEPFALRLAFGHRFR